MVFNPFAGAGAVGGRQLEIGIELVHGTEAIRELNKIKKSGVDAGEAIAVAFSGTGLATRPNRGRALIVGRANE